MIGAAHDTGPVTPGPDPAHGPHVTRARRRVETAEAILLALTALLTAWAAFQATKWGGEQASSYSGAGAARTESVRASNAANRQTIVDVNSYTSWIDAVSEEIRAAVPNGLDRTTGTYVPESTTQSAFLYERFRPEFRRAFDAWIATRPLAAGDAATTPFELPAYRLATEQESVRLQREADALATTAHVANQRGDNYVMMTILFALALVLIGVGAKMEATSIRIALTVGSGTALVVGLVVLLTFPIEL